MAGITRGTILGITEDMVSDGNGPIMEDITEVGIAPHIMVGTMDGTTGPTTTEGGRAITTEADTTLTEEEATAMLLEEQELQPVRVAQDMPLPVIATIQTLVVVELLVAETQELRVQQANHHRTADMFTEEIQGVIHPRLFRQEHAHV